MADPIPKYLMLTEDNDELHDKRIRTYKYRDEEAKAQ